MALYEIGTPVWVKSEKCVGFIHEANYHTNSEGKRNAHYLVGMPEGARHSSLLCGSKNLRRADFNCDGCGRWLPMSSIHTRDSETGWFCYLCTGPTKENLKNYYLPEYMG